MHCPQSNDLLIVFFVSGPFAAYASIRATQKAEKKCEVVKTYEAHMKEGESLW